MPQKRSHAQTRRNSICAAHDHVGLHHILDCTSLVALVNTSMKNDVHRITQAYVAHLQKEQKPQAKPVTTPAILPQNTIRAAQIQQLLNQKKTSKR